MFKIHRAIALAALPLGACATLLPTDDPGLAGSVRIAALAPVTPVSVTADSQLTSNPASNAADGNLVTAWANSGYRAATAWVAERFGSDVALGSVGVRMPPAVKGTSYDLQVSADGTTWTTALAGQTNSSWNVETKTLPAGTHGKALRLFWHNSATAPQPHVNVYELTASSIAPIMPSPAISMVPSPSMSATPAATPTPHASMTPLGTPVPAPGYPQVTNPGAHAAAGLVYNNGKPVAGVTIQVVMAGGGSKSAMTDATGHYSVSGLADGMYQAYYYNATDRNKLGYWRSRPITVNAAQGAAFPTIDLYLPGQINLPLPNTHIGLPNTFNWLGPIQPVVGFYFRVHSQPFTAFQLVFQSAKLTGDTGSYSFDGQHTLTGPLDPNHRYFWGVKWDWGPMGEGGNLYQAIYMKP